jgi:hypothetical protein
MMTFKPMTYLVSFTCFVLLFMGLGAYVGYAKFSDLFLTRSFLDAFPVHSQLLAGGQGSVRQWEDKVPLPQGVTASITASSQPQPILIRYSDEARPTPQPFPGVTSIPLATHERTEDIRVDRAGHYLYMRVFSTSKKKFEETTWLYKYDLQSRRVVRCSAVNPILLPAAFRP